MKTCTRCGELKHDTDFYWKVRAKGQRQGRCIECIKELRGSRPKDWMLSDEPRTCTACQVLKPADDFQFKNQKSRRRQSHCRPCMSDERSISGRGGILRQYGLSVADWEILVSRQEGRCAVCRKSGTDRLYVDHDHETGAVRGLLCMNCNSAIGHLRDDPVIIRRAADYLESAIPYMGTRGPHPPRLGRQVWYSDADLLEVYKLDQAGTTRAEIVATFNARGAKDTHGRPWTRRTVSGILTGTRMRRICDAEQDEKAA